MRDRVSFKKTTHLDRKLYEGVNLVPPVSVVGKPFEVDYQNLGQTPEVKLLSGLLVLLTVWTIPGQEQILNVMKSSIMKK